MQRRDYIERMIAQIAAAIARAVGLARAHQIEEAERTLDEAWTSGLGFRRADAARLDDTTLRMLLGAKAEHAAALFEGEAEVAEARGDAQAAAQARSRAAAMR
jgi:hypothetical protein